MIGDLLVLAFASAFLWYSSRVVSRAGGLRPPVLQEHPQHASVLIAARNEAASITATLQKLLLQNHPPENWEVVVVDDASQEGTADVLRTLLPVYQQAGVTLKLLSTTSSSQAQEAGLPLRQGKKQALMLALYHASHEHILVLDADCSPPPGWIQSMLASWKEDCGLQAGACIFQIDERASLFSRVVRLEYMISLLGGLSSLGTKHPAFASGANLAWTRTAFQQAGGYNGLEHIASADDTLLLQRIARRTSFRLQANIRPETTVESRGPVSIYQFLRQRIRWNSTQRHFPDRLLLLGAIGFYLLYLTMLITPLLASLGYIHWITALLALWMHFSATGLQALSATRLYNEKELLPLLPLVWLLQLCYICLTPLLGLVAHPRWRNR